MNDEMTACYVQHCTQDNDQVNVGGARRRLDQAFLTVWRRSCHGARCRSYRDRVLRWLRATLPSSFACHCSTVMRISEFPYLSWMADGNVSGQAVKGRLVLRLSLRFPATHFHPLSLYLR